MTTDFKTKNKKKAENIFLKTYGKYFGSNIENFWYDFVHFFVYIRKKL